MNKYNKAGVTWFQNDAAYLYEWARIYRDRGQFVDLWLAARVQENAAHSARMARLGLGLEA